MEPERAKTRKRRFSEGSERPSSSSNVAPEDILHPVYCGICSARLGLYDSDEVFHFFAVIASEP